MAKFTDYEVNNEIVEIIEKILKTYPKSFEGFDVNGIQTVITKGKKSRRGSKLHQVKYPMNILIDKVYFIEVFEETWKKFSEKKKGLSIFHQMCSIAPQGFDVESNNYGKKRKPDYEMFAEEFAVTNGVPNWLENDDARGVFEAAAEAKKTGKDVIPPTITVTQTGTTTATTPAKVKAAKAPAASTTGAVKTV